MRMAAGTARSNGSSGDEGVAAASQRWPVAALCCIAILAVMVLALLVMNILGVQLLGDDGYDPDVGGTAAEWFGAVATLVALPAAVLFGVRQLQSSGEAIEIERRRWETERTERAERQSAELAAVRGAVHLKVAVTNVVDAADLATGTEQAAIERWRREHSQRGWVPDADAWRQGAERRSNVDLLAAETSPLLPRPWFVVMSCHNTGTTALTVDRWTAQVGDRATTVDGPNHLGADDTLRHRLGGQVGLSRAYATRADAEAGAAGVTIVVDGRDGAGRLVRIVHPAAE